METKNMEQQPKTYSIKDLSLASFLLASDGITFIRVERKSDHIVVFHFSPPDKAKELADAYWSDQTTIQPRKLFGAQRDLKDLIFANKD